MSAVIVQDTIRVLQDLSNDKVRLIAPLYVTVEEADSAIVVSNNDLDLFGYGDTESEALQDLREIIAETYFDLQAEQDNLGLQLQAIWNYTQALH